MKLDQCMGGWCTRREKCAHYWAPKQRNVPPSERLCSNGKEHPMPVPSDGLDKSVDNHVVTVS